MSLTRLDNNENPYAWPEAMWQEWEERIHSHGLGRYPRHYEDLRQGIAAYAGVLPRQVMLGNGSDDVLLAAALALTEPGGRMVYAPPTFGAYRSSARVTGRQAVEVPLSDGWLPDVAAMDEAAAGGPGRPLIIFCRPNNPTGNLYPAQEIVHLAATAEAWVLVDEAYFEIAGSTVLTELPDGFPPNLVVTRTFSKAFGLAALRLGYAIASEEAASRLQAVMTSYAVNAAAVEAGLVALAHPEYVASSVDRFRAERERLSGALSALRGVRPLPSATNFILAEIDAQQAGLAARQRWSEALNRGVRLRYFGDEWPQLQGYLRVSVGSPEENASAVGVLQSLLDADRELVGGGGGAA